MKKIVLLLSVIVLVSACNVQKRVVYIQDIIPDEAIFMANDGNIRIKPLDRLKVVVSSSNPELAAPFNAATSFNSVNGLPSGSAVSGPSSLQTRTVDAEGYLNMPIIGEVLCTGKTRSEIASEIESKIVEGGYISDPSVNVEFADMKVTVLGEVNRPGQYDVVRDKMTLLEALAMAGDLTIYGMRDEVAVIREVNGETVVTLLDLRSKDIFTSPYYYLQQNDVVYVKPNRYKAATAEINQNRTFWLSLIGSLVSVSTLVISIVAFSQN